MPSYDYSCVDCLWVVTIVNSIKESQVKPPCKNCGVLMGRVYGSVAVSFKGLGFASNE